MYNDRPSATAILILKSMVFLLLDPRLNHLVPEEIGKISTQFLKTRTLNEKKFIRISKNKFLRNLVCLAERLLLPGIILHYVLRKRYIEEATFSIMQKGEVSQVVILAAGFDSLAFRLSEKFPKVIFIEVDHPATQEIKRRISKELGLNTPNVFFVSVDFAKEKLGDKLLSTAHFSPQAKTLFIAEGITMYLDEDQIAKLFSFISSCTQTQFIFTFMERQKDGTIDFKRTHSLVNLWLNLKREKFKWGISQERIADFLINQKFSIEKLVLSNTLRTKYLSTSLTNEPLAEGECICVAKAN